ncbi:MAG: RluA family pseudouridine synthase [Bdellovibrionota bacterium]
MSALRVLYKDDDLLVIDKDAGRVTEGQDTSLENEVQVAFDMRARALHRLDRGTSGVLAFSLRRLHHAAFVELWEKRRVQKTYWAWVEGRWPDALKTLGGSDADGREMQTNVKILKHHDGRSFLELSPKTGRRHQLRIQCANEGHPIIGDTRYGGKTDASLGESFALHARALEFVHPLSKMSLRFEAAAPASWKNFEETL